MQSLKPVLIRNGGKAKDRDFYEEVCQDRPQQVKVLVGTNIHPISKTETTGAPGHWQYNGQRFGREVLNPAVIQNHLGCFQNPDP